MKVSLDDLVRAVEQELDGMPEGSIGADTVLTDMPEWNSMYALLLMAFVSTEYGVEIRGEDLERIRTPRDIHAHIEQHLETP